MGKCRRTGLNDDYLPLFLASLEVRPFKVLGSSELTLTLTLPPASVCVLAWGGRRAKEGCLELGWALASSWLSWLMSWLSRLGFQNGWVGLGWLAAAGLKSIGRDLWGGEGKSPRERERREGDCSSLVGCSARNRMHERTNGTRERDRPPDTTRQDTAGTG